MPQAPAEVNSEMHGSVIDLSLLGCSLKSEHPES
jgi:hypothetical protein